MIPSDFHVHGALKCYTLECFRAIDGVQERLGWDTIDETYARMHGFRTESFPELTAIHHRPLASADGALRGHARHGECAYIAHHDPLWVGLRALKVSGRRPVGLSGGAFLFGYVRAVARRVERVPDPAYRRFAREELRRRMLGRSAPLSSAGGGHGAVRFKGVVVARSQAGRARSVAHLQRVANAPLVCHVIAGLHRLGASEVALVLNPEELEEPAQR